MTSPKSAASAVKGLPSPAQSSGSMTAGVKRKRPTETKFYGVREGRKPGVYASWAECLEQVKGHKNALFQAFPTLSAAEAFVAGQSPDSANGSSGARSYQPTKFYGVQVGRVPGVYTDWPSAQAQIVGWKNPKHRKFDNRAAAEAFVTAGRIPNGTTRLYGITNGEKTLKGGEGLVEGEQDGALDGPGAWPLPPGAEDGFDPNVKLGEDEKLRYRTLEEKKRRKIVPTSSNSRPGSLLKIYTDGSSLNNGQGGAVGGVGVYFGPGHKSNVSEPLPGPRQTNQRAELSALLRALEVAPLHRPVEIYTDSRYAIGCITQWYDNWVRKGWVTSKGHKVENKDLIVDIKTMVDERKEGYNVDTTFVWVKGHGNTEGNVMADKLAVQGAHGGNPNSGAKWEETDDEEYGAKDDQSLSKEDEEEVAADVDGNINMKDNAKAKAHIKPSTNGGKNQDEATEEDDDDDDDDEEQFEPSASLTTHMATLADEAATAQTRTMMQSGGHETRVVDDDDKDAIDGEEDDDDDALLHPAVREDGEEDV